MAAVKFLKIDSTTGVFTQNASTDDLTFGSATLGGAGTALNVTNNATIGGTLGVTGALTAGSISTAGALSAGAATVTSLNASSGGITNAGAIAGATTVTASGVVTAGSLVSASLDFAGALAIGGTNSTSTAIGKSGTTTTVKGSLVVDQNLTVTGTETIVGSSTFSANITLGPAGTATGGITTYSSVLLATQYSYWNGTAAVTAAGYGVCTIPSSAAVDVGDLSFLDGGSTERARLTRAGVWRVATVDALAAGALNIGTTTATSIALQQNTSVTGTLAVSGTSTLTGAAYANGGLDRSTAAALLIGVTNASAITLGKAAQTTTMAGTLAITASSGSPLTTVSGSTAAFGGAATVGQTLEVTGISTFTGAINANGGIDRTTATTMAIGGTNITTLSLGRTGQLVATLGNASVSGTLNVSGQSTLGLVSAGGTTVSSLTAGSGQVDTTGSLRAGNLSVTNTAATPTVDASGAGTIVANASAVLNIGTSAANTGAVNIGRTGQTTTIAGNLTVTGTFTGSVTSSTQVILPGFTADTTGVTAFHAQRISAADKVQAGIGTSITNATVVGFADATAASTVAVGVIRVGVITPVKEGAQTWTAGERLFLSASVAGSVTNVAPSTATQVIQRVGIAKSNTTMVIDLGEALLLA